MIDAATLDTLPFAGISEAEMRATALASRDGCDLWENDQSFIRRRVMHGPEGAPSLVFLPDGPGTIESYDSLIAALTGRFTVAVIELPGFGFSFAKKATALRFEDTCQLIAAALTDLNLSQTVLVGSCIQGLVAARVAEIVPDLAGLIIAQTGDFAAERDWAGAELDKDGRLGQPFTGQIAIRLTRERATIDWWARYSAGPRLDLDTFQAEARKVQRAGCSMALASQLQLWLGQADMAMPQPRLPTAILWGLADQSHTKTDRRSVLSCAPGAHYSEHADIGHFVDLEDPELIASTALALLSGAEHPTEI